MTETITETTELKAIYLIVAGASSARCVPDLVQSLVEFQLPIYTILTENAQNIISPYNLADQQGHTLVDSYFSPMLISSRAPGLTIIAPATFNSLNKIAHGIADTMAHSLAAEALGAGWPMIIAPSMTPRMANHPQVPRSLLTLREWGVTVLEPAPEGELLVMASVDEIIAAVRARLKPKSR